MGTESLQRTSAYSLCVLCTFQIVYDVKVLADKAEPVLEQVFHAIHSPPSAAHVVRLFNLLC
jgi:hypothetical protein